MKTLRLFLFVFACMVSVQTAHAQSASTSTLPLLTFSAPSTGAVIDESRDAKISWTIHEGVTATFSKRYSLIVLKLVPQTQGGETLLIGEYKLKGPSKHKAARDFKKMLKDEEVVDGTYKLQATLKHDVSKKCKEEQESCTATSTEDTLLIVQAARYRSESGTFTVSGFDEDSDEEAPPLCSSGGSGTGCTNSNVQPVLTSVSPAQAGRGSAVTLTGTRLQRASAVEFYTPSGRFKGAVNPSSVSSSTVIFTTRTLRAADISFGAYRIGVVTSECAGGCLSNLLNFTYSNQSSSTATSTTPLCNSEQTLVNGECVAATVSHTCSDGTVIQVPRNIPSTTRSQYCPAPGKPVITVTANGTNVFNGGKIQAPGGAATIEWNATRNPSCTLNGTSIASSGSNAYTNLSPASFVFSCTNSAGTTNLAFSIEVPVVTATTTTARIPTIRITANGMRVSNGDVVPTYNGKLTVEWGGTGATSCTVNGAPIASSGSQTFERIYNSTFVYTCTNSTGSRTVTFSTMRSPAAEDEGTTLSSKPTITIKANGTRVVNGGTVQASTGVVTFEWGSTGANACTLNGGPFALSGSQTYAGLSTTQYSYACGNANGTTTVTFNVVVPSVLGASSETACTALIYNLHRGHESANVKKLQDFLVALGLLDESTGFYGDKTVAAVKSYQESKGLQRTGMVYELTRAAIRGDSCK